MADNLWALREQKKLSVAALANRAGLPIGVIVEYESGQRSIDPRHLNRLARALYVEESEIRLHSDPRPEPRREDMRAPVREPGGAPSGHGPGVSGGTAPSAPAGGPGYGPSGARPGPRGGGAPREKAPRPRPAPKPPSPARPSQITHIESLLQRLGRTPAELENEIGKPLGQIDRPSASQLIKALQAQVAQANQANRHRAYLPEAVDQFEANYLATAQRASVLLHFKLFDGSEEEGQIIGYGPYSITIRQPGGDEVTINKLAVISYHTHPAPVAGGGAG